MKGTISMIENKLETINNLFEGNEIRSIWDGSLKDKKIKL